MRLPLQIPQPPNYAANLNLLTFVLGSRIMKKFSLLLFSLGSLSVLLMSHQDGSNFNFDYTGSADFPQTHCANAGCHNSIGFMGDGTINIQVLNGAAPVMSYSPGTTYTIKVTRPVNVSKVGFQSVVTKWASSTPTGTIANTIMPSKLVMNNITNGNAIAHTTAGSTSAISGGLATFEYQWTAPATDVGAIDVYAIMNISNNNGNVTGDSIMRAIFTLQKPTGIPECYADTTQGFVYPNPVQHTLNFLLPGTAPAQEANVVSLSGAVCRVPLVSLGGQAYRVDMRAFSPGYYTLRVALANGSFVRSFIKSSL